MPKVTFIVDHTPQGHAPDRPSYKKDKSYDLHISYAEKYKSRGLAVDFDEKAERERRKQQERAEAERKAAEDAAALAVKLEARGKILIPADLAILDWLALRDLAQSLSEDQIKNKDAALKAVETELARRNPTGQQG